MICFYRRDVPLRVSNFGAKRNYENLKLFSLADQELYTILRPENRGGQYYFTDFVKAQGINYKILKIHNSWLRDKN
jgi:hypothetical protein